MKYLLPKYAECKEKLFMSFDALWLVLMDITKTPPLPEPTVSWMH
jgi:hypothetical protein